MNCIEKKLEVKVHYIENKFEVKEHCIEKKFEQLMISFTRNDFVHTK